MIIVCEPLCKKFSHEKVNSGFLLALRLAFPGQAIRVYAESSHIAALRAIVKNDRQTLGDVEFVAIEFGPSHRLLGALRYWRMFRQVFLGAKQAGADTVFFLSFNPVLLAVIKWVLRARSLAAMKCVFVLHGDFDEIADDTRPSAVPPIPRPPIGERLRRIGLAAIPRMVARELVGRLRGFWRRNMDLVFHRVFTMRRALLWRHSPSIRYVALSPHIVVNASKYVDVDWLNIAVVTMPIVYAEPMALPENRYPRFAVFGYGDSAMLHQVLLRLASSRAAELPYEVRIIGMDARGTEGFRNISSPSPGKPMERADMEAQVGDIDAFLILYTSERYRLSCSGSIFEALSYLKPVLHFNNECVNWFNTVESPIGYRAENIDEYVENMVRMIEDYPAFLRSAGSFRGNLLALRDRYSLPRAAEALRSVLTWNGAQA